MDSPDRSMADAPVALPGPSVRRRLLGAGIVGLAGTLLPSLVGRAGATAPDEAAPTTTAPPQRPTAEDIPLLQGAQMVELAAVELYAAALAAGGVGPVLTAVLATAHDAHLAYAQALSAMLSTDVRDSPAADAVEALAGGFSAGNNVETATAAHELEAALVATHSETIGELLSTDAAALIASIMIVEARHSLVFGQIAGITDLDELIFTDADPLTPENG